MIVNLAFLKIGNEVNLGQGLSVLSKEGHERVNYYLRIVSGLEAILEYWRLVDWLGG